MIDCDGCNWLDPSRDDWLPGWILNGAVLTLFVILLWRLAVKHGATDDD